MSFIKLSFFDKLEEYLVASIIIVYSLMIFVQVVSRYVFGITISWTAETARYLNIWFIFLGSSYAVREGKHVCVDVVTNNLKGIYKRILIAIGHILSLVFIGILFYFSVQLTQNMIQRGVVTATTQIPMYWVYLAMPVGFALIFIRFSQQLWYLLKEGENAFTVQDDNRERSD